MSKSHQQNARVSKEKATNQARKLVSVRGAVTKPAIPVRTRETTEPSVTSISRSDHTVDPASAVKRNNNRISRPQQQQEPQPRPHPQQTPQPFPRKPESRATE